MEDEKEPINIAALGKSLYKRMITELEETHEGKMVVIDVLRIYLKTPILASYPWMGED